MESSQALMKRKAADMALMPAPALPKKIKRPNVVLDEDVYTDALSHIIARDFFPGLLESKAQQEYLDAVASNDRAWIREASRNLTSTMTPMPYGWRQRSSASLARTPFTVASTASLSETPSRRRAFQTPSRSQAVQTPSRPHTGPTPSWTPASVPADASDGGSRRPVVDLNLSLQDFQARYTSEDNASFNDVLDTQNAARVKKYVHLYDNTNKLPSDRLVAYRDRQRKMTETSGSEAVVLRPSEDLATRPASYDGFRTKQGVRNSFMFAADGVEDSLPTIADRAQEESLAAPKMTVYNATRLPLPETWRPAVPQSPSMSAVDAAIGGRPRYSESERASVAGDVYSGAETPTVNGFPFVDEDPTLAEEAAFARGTPVDEDTVARHESREAERLLPKLDGDASGAKFRFSDNDRREQLHYRMVEKNNQKARAKLASTTPSRGDMTPAARSLASRLATPLGKTVGAVFGVRASPTAWTPMRTPIVKKGGMKR